MDEGPAVIISNIFAAFMVLLGLGMIYFSVYRKDIGVIADAISDLLLPLSAAAIVLFVILSVTQEA